MDLSFSDLIDFSKVPIKIFLLFGIVSGLLLFGSDEFLMQLKLTEFEKDYGKFFGIIFIICVAFIGLSIIYYFKNKIENKINREKATKYLTEEIKSLDPSEQSVIREFVIQQKKSVKMPIDNATVAGLMNKGILKRVSNIGDGMYFPMSLTQIADKKIKESDLGISRSMSDIELREIFSNRPKWTDDYLYKQRYT